MLSCLKKNYVNINSRKLHGASFRDDAYVDADDVAHVGVAAVVAVVVADAVVDTDDENEVVVAVAGDAVVFAAVVVEATSSSGREL